MDDILRSSFEDNQFDCVYDKGTFDSITLVSDKFRDEDQAQPQEPDPVHCFITQVHRILKPNKYLVLISCNHSEEELVDLFANTHGFSLFQNLTEYFSDLRMFIWQKKSTA